MPTRCGHPINHGYVKAIEKVRKRATKLVISLKKYYLIRFGLPTLTYSRLRGDVIEVFKITKHKYDYKSIYDELIYNINKVTRRNDFRLSKIEVIMILGNFHSLIELLIFGTACLMLC